MVRERRWHAYSRFMRAFGNAAKELAHQYRAPRLATCSISERQFIRWMQGEVTRPRTDTRMVLEHLFQVRVEDLFAAPTTTTAQSAGGVAPLSGPGEGCDVSHPGSPQVEGEIMAAAHESARFAAGAEHSNVGPHTMEQLDADIRRIVETYPNRPVVPLFHEVKALRDRTFELLEGRQPPAFTKDLYLAAGVLCGVLANASFDLGYCSAAETQARSAYLCAELAGHNGLRVWIRGLQGLIAYWEGRPQDTVRLTESARSFTPEHGTAHIRLASIDARAHGSLGNTTAALEALNRSTRMREEAEDERDVPGGMMAFPLAKQHFYSGTTHLWLGGAHHLPQAQTKAEEALRLYEADPPETRRLGEMSLTRMDLALARLEHDEFDGTAEQVRVVLAVSSRRPTASVTKRLTHFAHRLSRHRAADTSAGLSLLEAVRDHRTRRALATGGEGR
jgi:hypothetical protein